MGMFVDNSITKAGRLLHGKLLDGAEFVPTRIVMGSGRLPEGVSSEAVEEVVAPVISLGINKKELLKDGKVVIGGMYTNRDITEPFYFRELALYAKARYRDESGAVTSEEPEVLYSYGNAGEDADRMPPYNTETVVERQMDLITWVGSRAKVDLTLDSSMAVSEERVLQIIREYAASNRHEHSATEIYMTVEGDRITIQNIIQEQQEQLKDPEKGTEAINTKLTAHLQNGFAHVQGAEAAQDNTFYGRQEGEFGFYPASSTEITTLPLPAVKWTPQPNQAGVYRQQITQADIVAQTKAGRTALDSFADLATEELLEYQGVEKLWLENQNGTPVAFAKGAKPAVDLAVQVRVIN